MLSYPKGTRYTVLTPIIPREGRSVTEQIEMDFKQGFTRLEVDGEMVRIEDYTYDASDKVYLLVDRMSCDDSKDAISRLTDSAETAMYEGDGTCMLRFYQPDGESRLHTFSTKFEADGIKFEEPNDQMFSFNSPIGACPVCEGFGNVIGIDEHLVIPNRALSPFTMERFSVGAVKRWANGSELSSCAKRQFRLSYFYSLLRTNPRAERRVLWHGILPWINLYDSFFKMLEENQYKIQYRVMLARYRGKTICPTCHGTRLKPESANYIKVGGKNIFELVEMPVYQLREFFAL